MVTPVMISSIHWGTYLFFAVVNACFIPVIYWFYPETKKRSLEEIDLIFAKGYLEKISYVKASFDMPFLSDREVEAMAREYGFIDSDEEEKVGEKVGEKAIGGDTEVPTPDSASGNEKARDNTRRSSEGTAVQGGENMHGELHNSDTQDHGFRND